VSSSRGSSRRDATCASCARCASCAEYDVEGVPDATSFDVVRPRRSCLRWVKA
jgi:hypothetical protein